MRTQRLHHAGSTAHCRWRPDSTEPRPRDTQHRQRTSILSRPTGPSELFTTLAMAMHAITVERGVHRNNAGMWWGRQQLSAAKQAHGDAPNPLHDVRTAAIRYGCAGLRRVGASRVGRRRTPHSRTDSGKARAHRSVCAHLDRRSARRQSPATWLPCSTVCVPLSKSRASWLPMCCGGRAGCAARGCRCDQPNRTRAARRTVIWASQTLGTPPAQNMSCLRFVGL